MSTITQSPENYTYDSGEGQGRAVVLAHEQPLQDDLVEFGICPPGQEAVQLKIEANISLTTIACDVQGNRDVGTTKLYV